MASSCGCVLAILSGFLFAGFNMKEIFKDIKGYEGYYQISNLGRVKSLKRVVKTKSSNMKLKERIIKQGDNGEGYKFVFLCKNKSITKYYIHRLVGIYFIKNIKNKPCINHKNGIKNDNRIKNLEWVTYKENMEHAFKTGLQKGTKGELLPQSKLKNFQIFVIRELIKCGMKQKEIANIYKVTASSISNIKLKKTWSHI